MRPRGAADSTSKITGLGHGGSIDVESEPEKTTVFRVRFPVTAAKAA